MKQYVITLLLALILSLVGCTKHQDDPIPAPVSGTGIYVLDGRSVSCKAVAVLKATNTGLNYLIVDLTTIPEPVGGPEVLELSFTKKPSEPVSTYQTADILLSHKTPNLRTLYFDNAASLTSTSSGGISGTFSTATRYTSISSVIKNGVFTDVHF